MRVSSFPIFSSLEEACACVGIEPRESRRHFTTTNTEGRGKHGRGAGRILAFPDGKGGMCFNWQTGHAALFYYGYGGARPNRKEIARMRSELRQQRSEYERQTNDRQRAVAALAAQIFGAAAGAGGEHAYLRRKGLQMVPAWGGLRCIRADIAQALIDGVGIQQDDGLGQRLNVSGRLLVVPLTDADGVLWSVQLIDEGGRKVFLKGGRKKGLLWCPEGALFNVGGAEAIGVAEGVATAMSVTLLYSVPCVAAIDAGNLMAAAESVRKRFPNYEVAFYADRDKSGVGEEKAREAALMMQGRGARCRVYLPPFTAEQDAAFEEATGKQPTDFNDYWGIWSK